MFFLEADEKIFSLLLTATSDLRSALEIAPHRLNFHQNNLQHFVIASMLDEMLNLETAIIRWQEIFSEELSEEAMHHQMGISVVQAVLNEINMYRRKNIEILADLILFKETNKEEYYKHYILIKEYDDQIRKLKDYKDFYSITPNNEVFMLDLIEKELAKSIVLIDERKCWFVNIRSECKNICGKNIRTTKSSFRYKLLQALKESGKYEKMALGLSYNKYAMTSKSIHYDATLNKGDRDELDTVSKTILLIIAFIVDRCQNLLNLYPAQSNTDLKQFVEDIESRKLWIEPLFSDVYELNDYVNTADDILGRIDKIIVSDVGYRSYRVKHLVNKHHNLYGDSGEYTALNLRRFQTRKQLESILQNDKNETIREFFTKVVTYEKITEGLDSLMTYWWENGYKEKVLYQEDTKFKETTKHMETMFDKEKLDRYMQEKIRRYKEA